MSDQGGFTGGLLLGVLLGAIIAVLYAPERGDKTRKKLAKKSGRWLGEASEYVDSAGDLMEKGRKKIGI